MKELDCIDVTLWYSKGQLILIIQVETLKCCQEGGLIQECKHLAIDSKMFIPRGVTLCKHWVRDTGTCLQSMTISYVYLWVEVYHISWSSPTTSCGNKYRRTWLMSLFDSSACFSACRTIMFPSHIILARKCCSQTHLWHFIAHQPWDCTWHCHTPHPAVWHVQSSHTKCCLTNDFWLLVLWHQWHPMCTYWCTTTVHHSTLLRMTLSYTIEALLILFTERQEALAPIHKGCEGI